MYRIRANKRLMLNGKVIKENWYVTKNGDLAQAALHSKRCTVEKQDGENWVLLSKAEEEPKKPESLADMKKLLIDSGMDKEIANRLTEKELKVEVEKL